MTLHDLAVAWVAEQTHGMITHRRIGETRVERKVRGIGRFEQDVIKTTAQGNNRALHEVEILSLNKQKVRQYGSLNKPKVLWIVVPKGTSNVFGIHLIEPTDTEGTFKEVRMVKTNAEDMEDY